MSRFQLLSDAQLALIGDLLPGPTGGKGRPFADARSMIEGIVYRYRYRYRNRMAGPAAHVRAVADGVGMAPSTCRDGIWDVVLDRLLTAADAAGQVDWSVSVDSTIARAHQHATNITRTTGGFVELHGSSV